MRTLAILLGLVAAVHAAPAPYPVTINSRSATAPNLSAYRSGQQVYRVTFTDGSTASDISGATAFMGWSTNATAATTSTATVSVVGATTGLVDFTFSPAALNYAPGRYIYEVGVLNASVPSVYRRGTFIIEGSPYSAGAAPITWTTNVNLGTINWIGTMPKANLPTDIVYGVIAAGTTNAAPSTSTNGSGIVTVNVPTNYAAGGGGGETAVYAALTMSGDQNNIGDLTWHTVAFDTVSATNGITASAAANSITIEESGLYLVIGQVRVNSLDSAAFIEMKPLPTSGSFDWCYPPGFKIRNNIYSGYDFSFTHYRYIGMMMATQGVTFVMKAYHTDTEDDVDLAAFGAAFTAAKIGDRP